jgi:hypothetical protein
VTARTPRRSAAQIIETGHQYPSTLSDGERALVVEVEALREQLAREVLARQQWQDVAFRWREKWIATSGALAQARGELSMNVVQLAGYRQAAVPGERHD